MRGNFYYGENYFTLRLFGCELASRTDDDFICLLRPAILPLIADFGFLGRHINLND